MTKQNDKPKDTDTAVPTPINVGTPPELNEEQRAALLVKRQRQLTVHAVLQQRFAEVEVERTIAVAERDQLVQQLQQLQQQLIAAQGELDGLKNPTMPEPADKTPDEGDGE